MFCLTLLLAAVPTSHMPDQARRVIEWQLRAPPRAPEDTGLSAEEAEVIRTRYLQSIGHPLPRSADRDATPFP